MIKIIYTFFMLACIQFCYSNEEIESNYFAQFIKGNPTRASLCLIDDGKTAIDYNSDRMSPLASTVKIIIAIEYAEQVTSGKLSAIQMVKIEELEKYYAPNTDGGAHPAWLNYTKENIVDNSIALKEIAMGMIVFSSNANTEYLIDLLGLENINKRVEKLGMNKHDKMFYLVSSLFIGKEYFSELDTEELVEKLESLSDEEYIEYSNEIHNKLKNDKSGKYRTEYGNLGMEVQQVWSDRLPSSTPLEYALLAEKINNREYFSKETHKHLSYTLESLMLSEGNQKVYKHAGTKGGSTSSILTKVIYATRQDGKKVSLSYFFNNLTTEENMKLQQEINKFESQILLSDEFRSRVVEIFEE